MKTDKQIEYIHHSAHCGVHIVFHVYTHRTHATRRIKCMRATATATTKRSSSSSSLSSSVVAVCCSLFFFFFFFFPIFAFQIYIAFGSVFPCDADRLCVVHIPGEPFKLIQSYYYYYYYVCLGTNERHRNKAPNSQYTTQASIFIFNSVFSPLFLPLVPSVRFSIFFFFFYTSHFLFCKIEEC